jgi:hypothetical protein
MSGCSARRPEASALALMADLNRPTSLGHDASQNARWFLDRHGKQLSAWELRHGALMMESKK